MAVRKGRSSDDRCPLREQVVCLVPDDNDTSDHLELSLDCDKKVMSTSGVLRGCR